MCSLPGLSLPRDQAAFHMPLYHFEADTNLIILAVGLLLHPLKI